MRGNKNFSLSIPAQDLPVFDLFQPGVEAAHIWAQALPIANNSALVTLLSQALGDLNRVKLAPEIRYGIVQALQPGLDVALANLSKRFLNQPLIMPTEPAKMADQANKLYTLVATAYTIVAVEAAQQSNTRNSSGAQLTHRAIQKALLFSGHCVLQALQLFRPLQIHGWQRLHQLFALAESRNLANTPLPDSPQGGSTIQSVYLQALLLACCKPNNLRQSDLTALYHALQECGDHLQLGAAKDKKAMFIVDLDSDQPPLYSTLYKNEPGPGCRYINTSALLTYLQPGSAGKSNTLNNDSINLPGHLLGHLITSMSHISLRSFNRSASNTELQVCVGLSSTHYHVSGGRTFAQLLHGRDYTPGIVDRLNRNPFIAPVVNHGVWAEANPGADAVKERSGEDSEALESRLAVDETIRDKLLWAKEPLPRSNDVHPVHHVQLADASPGGYCLEWTTELPGDIKSGDIVGIREVEDKDWAIAVVRWLSRLEQAKTLVGLELRSPRALPYGARALIKAGHSAPPTRALVLPEIKLVGQAQSLITPHVGFKEQQKVTLINFKQKISIKLTRQIAATGSHAQFEFQVVKELGDILAEKEETGPGKGSDSIWRHI